MTETRPFFVRVVAYTLLAIPAVLAVLGVIAAATGSTLPGPVFGPLVGFSFPCIVGAAIVVWRRRVPIVLVVLVGLMLLASAAMGLDFGVRHPESFYDFTGSVVSIAALGLAFVGGLAAIRKRRRQTLATPPTTRQRRAVLAVPILVGALSASSAGLTLARQPVVVTEGVAADVVTESDRFVPPEFTVTEGDTVRFAVRNVDDYAHTFSIDKVGIDQYLGPRADSEVEFDVVVPGDTTKLRLYCAVSGHEDMVGTIYVRRSARP